MRDRTPFASLSRRGQAPVPLATAAEVAAVLHGVASDLVAARAIVEVGPLPALVAEPTAFRALVRAIVLDALTFRGGMPPRIRVSAEAYDGGWWLSVADNGLPPETRAADGGRPWPGRAALARLGARLWREPGPDGGAIVSFTVATTA